MIKLNSKVQCIVASKNYAQSILLELTHQRWEKMSDFSQKFSSNEKFHIRVKISLMSNWQCGCIALDNNLSS